MSTKPGPIVNSRGELEGVRFAFGGMNLFIDPVDLEVESGMAVDLMNLNVDYAQNTFRRDGYRRVLDLPVSSAWSIEEHAYFVSNGKLFRYNGDATHELSGNRSISLRGRTEFKQVNEIVMFSDGYTIGYIDENHAYTAFNNDDWVDVLDVEQWVKSNMPQDPAEGEPNWDIDTFELSTMAGKNLEFFNGALYLSIGSWVFCTKTFDMEHMDIRYNVVAGFGEEVTMIARANDGLYVGTKSAVYFLPGGGIVPSESVVRYTASKNFEQQQVSRYGAIYGSLVKVNATMVPQLSQDKGFVNLFATKLGIFACGDGGKIANLSDKQVTIITGTEACAFFRDFGGVYQYIVSFNVDEPASLLDTIVVNTVTGSHSRYTNYPFHSFFELGDPVKFYAAKADGIYLLEGGKDYEGDGLRETPIPVRARTPVTDAGVQEKKIVKDGFLKGRFEGDAQVSFSIEEGEFCEPVLVPYNGTDGAQRRRVKLPFGRKGATYQFQVENVDGSYIEILELEVLMKASSRIV